MLLKTTQDIASTIKKARKKQGLTQAKLAMLCNVGIRFLSDLENAKPTCQLDKTLKVLNGLGINLEVEDDRF